ncbi:MAG: starch-binding protein [Muribaculaceae bacterium]|nr:starch-binding protein [Muribaculaceae bacterium]
MKKFSLVLMAMFVAIIAQAWTVNFTNPDGWTEVAVYVFGGDGEILGKWPGTKMTKSGSEWTLESTAGIPDKIIFNNNGGGKQTGNLDFVAGGTYDMNGIVGAELNTYSMSYNNGATNWEKVYVYTFGPEMFGTWPGTLLTAGSDGLYTFTVEATSEPTDMKVIFNDGAGQQTADLPFENGKVIGSTEMTYSYCLKGNWDGESEWTDLSLTEKDGKWVSEEVEIAQCSFGIKQFDASTGTQTDWYTAAGAPEVVLNKAMAIALGGSNFSIAAGKYTFTLDMTAMTLTVVGEGGDIPGIDYTTWWVNVPGEFNGWTDNGVNPNADGVAVLENLAIGNTGFKVKIWNGNEIWLSNGNELALDTPVTISGNAEANMTIAGGNEGDKYDVTFDCKNNTITVTKAGVVDYTTWYLNIVGPYNDWQAEGVQFNEDGEATVSGQAINAEGFKIKVWNGSADVWYSNGEELTLGTPATIVGNSDSCMTIATACPYYNVTFNVVSGEVVVTEDTTSGIAAVEATEVPVYYNLQGVKVANPVNGVFVKVVNGKASKVVL